MFSCFRGYKIEFRSGKQVLSNEAKCKIRKAYTRLGVSLWLRNCLSDWLHSFNGIYDRYIEYLQTEADDLTAKVTKHVEGFIYETGF